MLLPMLAATALGTMAAGVISGAPGKKARFFETMLAACAMMLLGCGLEITAGSEGRVEAKVLGFLAFIGLGFGLSAAAGTMVAVVEAPVFEHGEFIIVCYFGRFHVRDANGNVFFSICPGHYGSDPHLWRQHRHCGVVGHSRHQVTGPTGDRGLACRGAG
jgi:hypothetical protein